MKRDQSPPSTHRRDRHTGPDTNRNTSRDHAPHIEAAHARRHERDWMVERDIVSRGITDPHVLAAMREVPREVFVPEELHGRAYADRALPITEGQTISQPYVVALMIEAAEVQPGDRVLEVGTGSGYAAAVLSRIADVVYTVERHAKLAEQARERLQRLRFDNVHIAVRDGTRGWEEHAPYDAIIVAAGSPELIPRALREQLAPRGRLVIPRGVTQLGQDLIRVRRSPDGTHFEEENLGAVAFVPLIGEFGWTAEGGPETGSREERLQPAEGGASLHAVPQTLPERVAASAEAFADIESVNLDALLSRIGDARLVLIGEASHGTSEFYRMRARITQELIERKNFDFVAVEADWPDASDIDAYVRDTPHERPHGKPFQRFPQWMWANTDVMAFVHWLRAFNEARPRQKRIGFRGLDLYSMHASIEAVLHYLDDVDPSAAAVARERYACLTPWQSDPVLYGRASATGAFDECEADVLAMLDDLMRRRLEYTHADGRRFSDAVHNARLVASAEKYYRTMYRGSAASWNLRDQHMFDTLVMLLEETGPHARCVVWAHNSHVGDASATAMRHRGEFNVGQLARQSFGPDAYLIGFGTHTGTVAAASDWGEPMQIMNVRPSHPHSYEHVAYESGVARFLLPLRSDDDSALRDALLPERLERAIGVIYRPDTELQSHYFHASLPHQFDEWIWFDESTAVTPVGEEHRAELEELPDTFPFGL
ncbi:MAG: protein-L-isoaspartate(D-aspartate) O-methyltransferase [Longimicrobiales bacterium]